MSRLPSVDSTSAVQPLPSMEYLPWLPATGLHLSQSANRRDKENSAFHSWWVAGACFPLHRWHVVLRVCWIFCPEEASSVPTPRRDRWLLQGILAFTVRWSCIDGSGLHRVNQRSCIKMNTTDCCADAHFLGVYVSFLLVQPKQTFIKSELKSTLRTGAHFQSSHSQAPCRQ